MKAFFLLTCGFLFTTFLVNNSVIEKPRVLDPAEVPVAFWAWRNAAPAYDEVKRANETVGAGTLFLRAGQFDAADSSIRRIRPVSGKLGNPSKIHLVYNTTRRFLSQLESLGATDIARAVAETYLEDKARGQADGAEIVGLQLDIDVPTRLLPKYAETMRELRKKLPAGTKLSITGLPTWLDDRELSTVLESVDFWIPQCYGTTVSTNAWNRVPISSAAEVTRIVAAARRLGRPFYAGLSAYGYAALYDTNGDLVELRGDIDPARVQSSSEFDLIDTRQFGDTSQTEQSQFIYRARSDLVIDGLIVKTGERLLLELPSDNSLRLAAKAVRENAGDQLLGICVFRLPTENDATNLSISEVAAALADVQSLVASDVRVEALADNRYRLVVQNKGSARAVVRPNALTIDITVVPGILDSVSISSGPYDYETLCEQIGTGIRRPCSPLRANVLRLTRSSWAPGSAVSAEFELKQLPSSIPIIITTRVNDGRVEHETFDLKTEIR